MPTDRTPEPVPFGGWRPTLTLSRDEVLDVIATLKEVLTVLAERDLFDSAEELASVSHHLLSRLEH